MNWKSQKTKIASTLYASVSLWVLLMLLSALYQWLEGRFNWDDWLYLGKILAFFLPAMFIFS